MDHPKSSLGRLSPSWQAAIRDHEIQTRILPMEWRKESARHKLEDSAPYLHSSELQALIAQLKRERMRRGLSMGDVARLTDQARSAISRLENGQYPNPTLDTVYRYAVALGMHITLVAKPLSNASVGGVEP